MSEKKAYIIPGKKITSLESFYEVIGEVINGPGGYFGNNLDAFSDYLRGGFGTPSKFKLIWIDSEISRKALGYEETIRQLKKRLKECHPSNRESVQLELNLAKKGQGPTVFDWLIEIIESSENVELELK